MATLELERVAERYGTVEVIRGVDFAVPSGAFCVFVGPSGCSKPTLSRMVAGLETVSGGEIRIDGRRVDELPPARRGLAVVFQSYALDPHVTVRRNLAFGLENLGTPKAEIARRVAEAARMLRIEELLDRRPKALSGGQRQRVAIGRAVVREPEIFLFDEPLSNLDAELRVQMRIELEALHARLGNTMIYVTHDQVEATIMADPIVVLSKGRIEQAGPPLELYHRPANLFVAGFLGSPKMKFLSVRPAEGGVRLASGDLLPMSDLALGTGELTLGVRPEHLRRAPAEAGIGLTGRVRLVEHPGAELHLHLETAAGPLTLRTTGGKAAAAGDRVRVPILPEACHLFGSDGRVVRSAPASHLTPRPRPVAGRGSGHRPRTGPGGSIGGGAGGWAEQGGEVGAEGGEQLSEAREVAFEGHVFDERPGELGGVAGGREEAGLGRGSARGELGRVSGRVGALGFASGRGARAANGAGRGGISGCGMLGRERRRFGSAAGGVVGRAPAGLGFVRASRARQGGRRWFARGRGRLGFVRAIRGRGREGRGRRRGLTRRGRLGFVRAISGKRCGGLLVGEVGTAGGRCRSVGEGLQDPVQGALEPGGVRREGGELGRSGEQDGRAVGVDPAGRRPGAATAELGLEPVAAGELPEGDGEALDQKVFGQVPRPMLGAQIGEELGELVRVLAGEEQGRGRAEAVAQGVARRTGLAFGGDRPARAGAVAPRGSALGLAAGAGDGGLRHGFSGGRGIGGVRRSYSDNRTMSTRAPRVDAPRRAPEHEAASRIGWRRRGRPQARQWAISRSRKASQAASWESSTNSSGLWACSMSPGPQTIAGMPPSRRNRPPSVP
jgi:multiple sugar transport system ATP-binding protein